MVRCAHKRDMQRSAGLSRMRAKKWLCVCVCAFARASGGGREGVRRTSATSSECLEPPVKPIVSGVRLVRVVPFMKAHASAA